MDRALPVDTAGKATVSAVDWLREDRIDERLAAINANPQFQRQFAPLVHAIRTRQALTDG